MRSLAAYGCIEALAVLMWLKGGMLQGCIAYQAQHVWPTHRMEPFVPRQLVGKGFALVLQAQFLWELFVSLG